MTTPTLKSRLLEEFEKSNRGWNENQISIRKDAFLAGAKAGLEIASKKLKSIGYTESPKVLRTLSKSLGEE